MDGFKLFSSNLKRKVEAAPTINHKPVESVEEDQIVTQKTQKIESFASLGLSQFLINALSSLSITVPTPVQCACIPAILSGTSNVIGVAKTGSGKTAAFLLPILDTLAKDPYGIYAVIVTPNRELAFQIGEQVKIFGEGIHIKFTMVVGGTDMLKQAIEMKKRPHILVCTPGRLADHLKSNSDVPDLRRVKYLVLDEADRLFEQTYEDDMDTILSRMPPKRQTLLFTATLSDTLRQIQTPETFVYQSSSDSYEFEVVQKLKYQYILSPSSVKDAHLIWYLRNSNSKSTLIFCSKRNTAIRLTKILNLMDIPTLELHAELPQGLRTDNLDKFRTGTIKCLVATGVVSRGVDIPTVGLVVQYDLPSCTREFIHRSGRTARAGRGGVCISLVSENDVDLFLSIENALGKTIESLSIDENAVNALVKDVAVAKKTAIMAMIQENDKVKEKLSRKKQKAKRTKI